MKSEHILEQDIKLKFPHIYAIDASAGAGKTHNLTLRYIQFILSPVIKRGHYNYIGAITFTNRAANEMKTRILRMLKEIALDEEDRVREVSELVALKREELVRKSGEVIDDIIRNFSDLKIGTIDSFINSIIRSSAIETGVPPDFEVITDPVPIIEFAIDELLEKIDESKEIREIIDKFIETFLILEDKRGWYPKKFLLDKVGILRRKQNEEGILFALPRVTPVDIKEIETRIREFLELSKKHCLSFDSRAEEGLLKFLETKNISAYLARDTAGLFKKKNQIPEELEELWKKIQRDIENYYESKAELCYYPYILVLKNVEKELEQIRIKKGVIFIDELNVYVKKLIENFNVPYLYYKLGEEIAHYMIDEFQDTNEIQWMNIQELVENSLSEGGSLFYVGDKKQAIYRFRGGRAELFDEVKSSEELRRITQEVYTKTLTLNRRSRTEIINFNNSLFSIHNLMKIKITEKFQLPSSIEEFRQMLKATYANSAQVQPEELTQSKSGGYVYLKPLNDNQTKGMKKEEYGELIKDILLKKIKEVISRGNKSDIAILVRTRGEVKTVTEWLLGEKIDTVSETAGDIREHPLIRELFSFLKFLNDPSDNLAFAGFISGEIFTSYTGLERESIYKWFNQIDLKHTFLYKRFQEWEKGAPLWKEHIEYFFKNADLIPAYDIACELLDRFRVFSRFKSASGFFIHFLEVIRSLEDEGKNNIDFIIQEWERSEGGVDIFAVPLNLRSAAVKVMTIHMAKGLEFSVVFLPFAGVSAETESRLIMRESKKVVNVDKDALKLTPTFLEVFEREKAKSIIDELNVLYVACTRAKDELYIIVPPKVGSSENLLLSIPPFTEGEKEYGKKITFSSAVDTTSLTEITIFDKPATNKWSDRFQGLKSKEDLINSVFIEEKDAIKKGNLVHQVLSKIIQPEELEEKGRMESLLGNAGEELKGSVLESLKSLFQNTEFIKLFAPPQGGKVFTETELVGKSGEIKRVDRMIIENGRVTVIDFKTGRTTSTSSDRRQIEEYKRLVQEIYPGREVRGFLVYLEPLEIMEI